MLARAWLLALALHRARIAYSARTDGPRKRTNARAATQHNAKTTAAVASHWGPKRTAPNNTIQAAGLNQRGD
jgi:hypothetical protein